MKIIVAVRCYNESKNIRRFMKGYDFADEIVVSDGGSEDSSISILEEYPKVRLFRYENYEVVEGERWNPDGMHINFVLNKAKELKPDWLIFDDMDCVPNERLKNIARDVFESCGKTQVNVFRLYLWGEGQYFPHMNRYFNPLYRSLWAWRPDLIDIRADESIRHGTIIGTTQDNYGISVPNCLLHRSWHPNTIDKKVERYNKLGLTMNHPLSFAGEPADLPEWAKEQE